MNTFHANLMAVVAAAILQWLIGWLWYGVIFSKSYKSLVSASENQKSGNPGGVMALIFVTNLILAFALAQIILLSGVSTITMGMFVGVVCGLGFVAPPLLAQHVSEGKPFKLYGINSIYWLLAMALSGSLLAIWR